MLKTYSNSYFSSSIWSRVSSNEGLRIPHSNYWLKRQGNNFTLHNPQIDSAPLFRLIVDNTAYCCGVAQLGGFYERQEAINVPDAVLAYVYKVITSTLRFKYRKGIAQGWFYRYNRSDAAYQHPTIRRMFENAGMTKIGVETFNPNSGNVIQGFQGSISRRGTNGNS
jgi:hypothetical protein